MAASHDRLAQSTLFDGLGDSLLERLGPALSDVSLAAGEALVSQGDVGDAVFVLNSGQLEVTVRTDEGRDIRVDVLEPGATVGEMALVAGQIRTATVRALKDSRLIRLARHDFDLLADGAPELRDALIRQMEPRLQRVQLSAIMERWFPDFTSAQIHELQNAVSWLQLAGGETLYSRGDAADGMYLLVSGRLRILADGALEPAAELGRGASIGEMAVLGDAPRGETVVAIRDSRLVRLDRSFVARHPEMMAQIARNVLERVQDKDRGAARRGNGVRTIVIVPADDRTPATELAGTLESRLEHWGPALTLSARDVDVRFGRDGAAQTERGSPLDPALAFWLNETESRHDCLLLVADSTLTPWTMRCLGQADLIIVAATAGADPQPGEVEQLLTENAERDWQLVLIHEPATVMPSGTAEWLKVRPPLTHHHVRLSEQADMDRLARRLTGRAIGIALSGGGARGYVHLGLIRALESLGIPVDMVAGTSMGALVGGGFALTRSFQACMSSAERFGDPKKLLDKTLPLVALAESRNVTESLRSIFGETAIEDMWIPFTCVSANLTRAEPVLHQQGPAWEAVRASTAIPGIFTPVVRDGDVLVDGGIMNNYPVDILRAQIGTGFVIGSNAESASRARAFEFGPSVSGWRVLLQRFLPAARRRRYPSIFSTLMRATSVSSKHLGAAADTLADVTLRYPAESVGNLEFDRYQQAADIGFTAALEALTEWLAAADPLDHASLQS